MSPVELAETLALLRWPYREVAAELGCDEKMIRRWLDGSSDMPAAVAAWFSECRKIGLQIVWPKAPQDWRRHQGYAPPAVRRRRRAARAA